MVSGFADRFKKFDVFREIPKDLTQASSSGAAVSIICVLVVGYLFITEFVKFLTITTVSSMYVELPDDPLGDDKLKIDMDIELFGLPCAVASVDVQDIIGAHSVDVAGSLTKYRLDSNGQPKKDGRGRPLASANHPGEAQAKEQAGEGCHLKGYLLVNKVPGNCHISSHGKADMLPRLLGSKPMNLSHRINHLGFGERIEMDADAAFHPLNGLERIADKAYKLISHQGHSHAMEHCGTFEYYIKVVPTIYQSLHNDETRSYQFTASQNHFEGHSFPAIYFRYDFSPITVQFTQESEPIATFLVEIFAIVGGVFTGFSILSMWVNAGVHRIMKKQVIGKLG